MSGDEQSRKRRAERLGSLRPGKGEELLLERALRAACYPVHKQAHWERQTRERPARPREHLCRAFHPRDPAVGPSRTLIRSRSLPSLVFMASPSRSRRRTLRATQAPVGLPRATRRHHVPLPWRSKDTTRLTSRRVVAVERGLGHGVSKSAQYGAEPSSARREVAQGTRCAAPLPQKTRERRVRLALLATPINAACASRSTGRGASLSLRRRRCNRPVPLAGPPDDAEKAVVAVPGLRSRQGSIPARTPASSCAAPLSCPPTSPRRTSCSAASPPRRAPLRRAPPTRAPRPPSRP